MVLLTQFWFDGLAAVNTDSDIFKIYILNKRLLSIEN